MQAYLVSGHVHRLERAKRAAAGWALRRVSLGDHSDLVSQSALCLQSVINQQRGDTLRDQLDQIGEAASSGGFRGGGGGSTSIICIVLYCIDVYLFVWFVGLFIGGYNGAPTMGSICAHGHLCMSGSMKMI